ncbi:unnamed protein product [Closterium sp. NIES-65]|nr:unnamed protein product [Closterium sp. NIES-65]
MRLYDELLSSPVQPNEQTTYRERTFFQRHLLAYTVSRLDQPFSAFRVDDDLDEEWRVRDIGRDGESWGGVAGERGGWGERGEESGRAEKGGQGIRGAGWGWWSERLVLVSSLTGKCLSLLVKLTDFIATPHRLHCNTPPTSLQHPTDFIATPHRLHCNTQPTSLQYPTDFIAILQSPYSSPLLPFPSPPPPLPVPLSPHPFATSPSPLFSPHGRQGKWATGGRPEGLPGFVPLAIPEDQLQAATWQRLPRLSGAAVELVEAADLIGARTHYDTDGMLHNTQQLRMAGLASLDVMQQLRMAGLASLDVMQQVRRTLLLIADQMRIAPLLFGTDGPDGADEQWQEQLEQVLQERQGGQRTGRSRQSSSSGGSSGGGGSGVGRSILDRSDLVTSWRHVFRVLVAWRQVSEAQESIAWKAFGKGQRWPADMLYRTDTPIFTWVMGTARYLAVYPKAVNVTRQGLLQSERAFDTNTHQPFDVPRSTFGPQLEAAEDQERLVNVICLEAAEDHKGIFNVIGRDFYVRLPCYSRAFPGVCPTFPTSPNLPHITQPSPHHPTFPTSPNLPHITQPSPHHPTFPTSPNLPHITQPSPHHPTFPTSPNLPHITQPSPHHPTFPTSPNLPHITQPSPHHPTFPTSPNLPHITQPSPHHPTFPTSPNLPHITQPSPHHPTFPTSPNLPHITQPSFLFLYHVISTQDALTHALPSSYLLRIPCAPVLLLSRIDCPSSRPPTLLCRKDLGGTEFRLRKRPLAVDFDTVTPIDATRWNAFDSELTAAWQGFMEAALDHHTKATSPHTYRQRIQDQIIAIAYYWFQLMPLSRGSAMVGLMSILGLSMAAGMETTTHVPRDILSPVAPSPLLLLVPCCS